MNSIIKNFSVLCLLLGLANCGNVPIEETPKQPKPITQGKVKVKSKPSNGKDNLKSEEQSNNVETEDTEGEVPNIETPEDVIEETPEVVADAPEAEEQAPVESPEENQEASENDAEKTAESEADKTEVAAIEHSLIGRWKLKSLKANNIDIVSEENTKFAMIVESASKITMELVECADGSILKSDVKVSIDNQKITVLETVALSCDLATGNPFSFKLVEGEEIIYIVDNDNLTTLQLQEAAEGKIESRYVRVVE